MYLSFFVELFYYYFSNQNVCFFFLQVWFDAPPISTLFPIKNAPPPSFFSPLKSMIFKPGKRRLWASSPASLLQTLSHTSNPSKLPTHIKHTLQSTRSSPGWCFLPFHSGGSCNNNNNKKKPASSTTLQLRSQGLLHEILCITEAWWVEEKRSDRQGWDFHSCSTGTSAVIPPAVQTVTPLIRGCHVLNGREATLWNILHSSSISRSVPCRVLEIGAYRKWRSGLN